MTTEAATPPHIALFPSSGMGHLIPFLRLASMLSNHNCSITLITTIPRVSDAESIQISSFLSAHPNIMHLEFQLNTEPAQPENDNPGSVDPFFRQYDLISKSTHQLRPLLSSVSNPILALIIDLAGASNIAPIADDLSIPLYILCTSSIRFFAIMAQLPVLAPELANRSSNGKYSMKELIIPGIPPVPISSIPPPFSNPNHIFTSMIITNILSLPKSRAILVNDYDWFESSALASLNNGRAIKTLPPLLPIGPLQPYGNPNDQAANENYRSWLDDQPVESVVYISFGSRTAMPREQILEIAKGLERSRCRFIWILKTTKVDKDEDSNENAKGVLGDSFFEETGKKGLVLKGWVNQEEILAHPGVGGFISHCGWNSVMEAAWQGKPVLAWPQHGDQRVNAEVLERAGLGMWEKDWGMGSDKVVDGEDIGEKILALMKDVEVRERARKVKEEARKAMADGGSSCSTIKEFIHCLRQRV